MEKHKFKKKYGQNFLYDKNILEKIYKSINPTPEDLIIEIGPGSGNLTKYLQKYNSQIICYEIDESLKEKLDTIKNKKTEIIYKDFMQANLIEDISKYNYNKIYVIANIPYYITTPIIEKITFSNLKLENMLLMVQKEVAERLSAKPNSKDYGYITVMLNYFYNITTLFNVGRNCFYPVPNVDSAIIKLTPHENENNNFSKFNKFIQDAFKFKRKTLRNNLKKYNLEKIEQILNKYGHTLSDRAESISIDIYIEIADSL